ncbi:hypothetical protein CEXT_400761 [Caerostris extrusa]|uniref:Uncharacterized protein n=1 Tax=Caerostris extrusa TaxID=172846 RepID=A0AAV4TM19_CAEEX|nr:hypothetical protein CEXT_400761 [Caerostris extrusa]
MAQPAAYVNLAYEQDSQETKPDMSVKMEECPPFNPPNEFYSGYNIPVPIYEPSAPPMTPHYGILPPADLPQITRQPSQDHQLNDERGISVNVQTKIISTKITKVRTPRSKEFPILLKKERIFRQLFGWR